MRLTRPVPLLLAVLAACSGGEPKPRPVPARLAITQQPVTVVAGDAFQLTVAIQDSTGATVQDATSNITVAFTTGGHVVTTGARALGGTVTRAAVAGVATFDNLTINRDGGHVLAATSGQLNAANTGVIVVNPAAAAQHEIEAGDNQVAPPNADVEVKPSVRVTDAFGNGVNGLTVTFAVASGGGAVTGATQTTNNGGVATVGAWTLGSAGDNTLTATVSGASVSARTFNARVSTVFITGVSPALLAPGVVATVTGSGFSTTLADNNLTLDGTAVTVTGASPTTLTFTVPPNLACEPTHDGTVRVAVGQDYGTRAHPIQAARQRSLAIGEALIVSDPAEARCNEFAPGASQYLVSVYNTSRVMATGSLPVQFALRGASATGAAAGGAAMTGVRATAPIQRAAPDVPVDEGERLHARILEENLRILEQRRGELREQTARARLRAVPARAMAVGDIQAVRIPNVNANFCSEYFEVSTKVVYAGTRTIILEDVTNQLAGQIDSTWSQIGQEFDDVMYGILADNFGDPLVTDAATDNNGKIIMVFSKVFNEQFSGLAGFVVSCDYSPRGTTSNQSSNFGEYFYARVPTTAGTLAGGTSTPPGWRWATRATIIHEVKHIASFGARISTSAPFESSWLEESLARVSEELFERQQYGFAQRDNIGYGSSGDPRGVWCDVRGCNGKSRGIARIFEDLNVNWYRAPQSFSPIGRKSATDFSFYNTGWSLVRWAVDHSATAEATFLTALTNGPETGLTNLETRAGRAWTDMLPEWSLAMALDDDPLIVPANVRLKQPSWNLRNLMEGLGKETFQNNPYVVQPFNPESHPFGAFAMVGQVFPGTAQFLRVGGVQTAKQLIELRASLTTPDAAPAELRVAVVRIQ